MYFFSMHVLNWKPLLRDAINTQKNECEHVQKFDGWIEYKSKDTELQLTVPFIPPSPLLHLTFNGQCKVPYKC